MAKLIIDRELCTECGECVDQCIYGALSLEDDGLTVDVEKCMLCGACEESCPNEAITIPDKKAVVQADRDSYHGIWIYAEQWESEINEVAFELLNEGKRLAEKLGEDISAVLIGSRVKDKVAQLSGYGAGRVYLVDHQICKVPEEELYAKILSDLAETYKPKIILFGATALGRTLAPRLAARLGTGLTADCTVLDVDAEKGLLLQTRPAFGGNVMATILCPDVCPQMATVRPKVFSKGDSDAGRTCELITHDAALDRVKTKTRIKRVLPKDSDGEVRLEDAEVVVAGGAGCGSKEGFALVHQLAEALGGTVAATRPPVEEGWVDHSVQVGQTGKVIAPKLYIALGIAGAVQHAIGMQSADMIIAVNKDPDAAIFQLADIGIVGDMFEVVPQLIKQIKEKGLVVPTKQ